MDDCPTPGTRKSQEYLGITPPDAAEGCLQDIHWSRVGFAGFPGYTLGNIIGAQLFAKAHEGFPPWTIRLRRASSRRCMAGSLRICTATGASSRLTSYWSASPAAVEHRPWIAYVRRKFADLYGIAPA